MALNLSYWTVSALVLGLVLALPTIMGFFSSHKFDVNGKTVLLTGASEGMGLNVAIKLAKKGASIIIVARTVPKLEAAIAQIKAAAPNSSQRFHYISADLSVEDGATRVIAEAIEWNNNTAPDVIWCIAGASFPGLFIETSKKLMREQMDINYWSCADMAHAILPHWLSPSAPSGRKHLIFTSSVVAFYAIVGYAPYAPAKAAIKSLSDTLAQEMLLYGEDVKIHTVFPGTILSAGYETENLTKPGVTHKIEEMDPKQTPEAVAQAAIEGLERGEYLVTDSFLGGLARATSWGNARRGNNVRDSLWTAVVALIAPFVAWDMNRTVKGYRKTHGHPSEYKK